MFEELIYKTSEVINIISIVIAFVVLITFQKLSFPLRIFGYYLIIDCGTEILSSALANNNYNNLVFFHIYTFLEFWFISIFFFHVLGIKNKIYLFLTLFIVESLVIINSIFFQSIFEFNTYSSSLAIVIILTMCLFYFYKSLEYTIDDFEFKTIHKLIILLFFYECLSLMIILFSNHLVIAGKSYHLTVYGIRALIVLFIKIIYLFIYIVYVFKKTSYINKLSNYFL